MIKDPYIGMPINMGGRCDTMQTTPPMQHTEQPQLSTQTSQASQPPQNVNQQATQKENLQQLPSSQDEKRQAMQQSAPQQSENIRQAEENTSSFDATLLENLPLAMAYVPMQQWKNIYPLQEGLSRGTIFHELDLPFEGRTILSERNNGRRMR